MATVHINNGETCLFWQDSWGRQPLENSYPKLSSFAKDRMVSVKAAWEQGDMTHLLQIPVSDIAYNQLQILIQRSADIHINEGKDIWRYPWGNNFSSSRAYKIIVGHSQHHPSIQSILKCFCQPKHLVSFFRNLEGLAPLQLAFIDN